MEPLNRAMYYFNDKLYFWLLKPVAQGYGKVVPDVVRIGVGNFFTNLAFPVRLANSLLQTNFSGAAQKLVVSYLRDWRIIRSGITRGDQSRQVGKGILVRPCEAAGWDRAFSSSGLSWGPPTRGIGRG